MSEPNDKQNTCRVDAASAFDIHHGSVTTVSPKWDFLVHPYRTQRIRSDMERGRRSCSSTGIRNVHCTRSKKWHYDARIRSKYTSEIDRHNNKLVRAWILVYPPPNSINPGSRFTTTGSTHESRPLSLSEEEVPQSPARDCGEDAISNLASTAAPHTRPLMGR